MYKRHILFIKYVVNLTEQHGESEINWNSKDSDNSVEEEKKKDDKDKWTEIKYIMYNVQMEIPHSFNTPCALQKLW